MHRFYLSMDCDTCEEEIFYGPVATTIIHNGLPVLPYDTASQETFTCDNCGAEHYLGDFDFELEPGEVPADDEPEEATTA